VFTARYGLGHTDTFRLSRVSDALSSSEYIVPNVTMIIIEFEKDVQ